MGGSVPRRPLALALLALFCAALRPCSSATDWQRVSLGRVTHASLAGRHVRVATAQGVVASLSARTGDVGTCPRPGLQASPSRPRAPLRVAPSARGGADALSRGLHLSRRGHALRWTPAGLGNTGAWTGARSALRTRPGPHDQEPRHDQYYEHYECALTAIVVQDGTLLWEQPSASTRLDHTLLFSAAAQELLATLSGNVVQVRVDAHTFKPTCCCSLT